MFQLIDTALAFAAVMLLLSLLITVVVQLLVSTFGLRGRYLVWAITQLLQRVSPAFATEAGLPKTKVQEADAKAKEKAKQLLSDPLLAPTFNVLTWVLDGVLKRRGRKVGSQRPPTEIKVKDLAQLLGYHDVDVGAAIPAVAPNASKKRILDPDAVDAIEKRIAGWFDTVMAAAGARLKLRTRWITIVGASILAFGFQVDSLAVLDNLSDEQIRLKVIEQIDDINAFYQAQTASEGQDAAGKETVENARKAVDDVLKEINETQAFELHRIESWRDVELTRGKLMTVLLLSLGAPFWYGVLGKLVGFRSAVKPKQEQGGNGNPNP